VTASGRLYNRIALGRIEQVAVGSEVGAELESFRFDLAVEV
jgi:hypothetical protein